MLYALTLVGFIIATITYGWLHGQDRYAAGFEDGRAAAYEAVGKARRERAGRGLPRAPGQHRMGEPRRQPVTPFPEGQPAVRPQGSRTRIPTGHGGLGGLGDPFTAAVHSHTHTSAETLTRPVHMPAPPARDYTTRELRRVRTTGEIVAATGEYIAAMQAGEDAWRRERQLVP